MKIIKEGINPIDIIFRGTCNNCGLVLEFHGGEASELPAFHSRDSYINCPNCRTVINGMELRKITPIPMPPKPMVEGNVKGGGQNPLPTCPKPHNPPPSRRAKNTIEVLEI